MDDRQIVAESGRPAHRQARACMSTLRCPAAAVGTTAPGPTSSMWACSLAELGHRVLYGGVAGALRALRAGGSNWKKAGAAAAGATALRPPAARLRERLLVLGAAGGCGGQRRRAAWPNRKGKVFLAASGPAPGCHCARPRGWGCGRELASATQREPRTLSAKGPALSPTPAGLRPRWPWRRLFCGWVVQCNGPGHGERTYAARASKWP